MEELKDNRTTYDRGIVMLKNALKKYEDGEFESAEKDRKLANELLDKANKEESEEVDIETLYGESRNFGVIYNVIVENTQTALTNKKGLKELGKVLKHVKSNKILKEQFEIYSSLEKTQIKNDVEHFVNEAVSMLPSYKKKNLIKENNNLIKLIRQCNLSENVTISDEKRKLYEAIEFIITNKRNIANIDSIKSHKDTILEYVEKNNKVIEEASKNKPETLFKESMTEDEKKLLQELSEGKDEEVFNRYKDETIQLISEQVSLADNLNDKIDWNNMMTRMMVKQYNPSKLLEDICDFINVQNIINE